ncbi:hypothetical protein D9758_003829 [Tetrapyrgos nigripes]|uniref:Myb/SANT-like domain-containing protein n=1 Tax=Tetrapyrgos nigripes TaxID=182062 RepID=A0A8H5GMF6_9AGAR|nr:hypothetical protein D9758_003829 [Tetrapyrgos nigripes]
MWRVKWSNSDVDIMIDELKNQKAQGNQSQSSWKPDTWTTVSKRIIAEGSQEGAEKNPKKCSDKYGTLKAQYKTVHYIRTKASGFGWDEQKQMVVATDEWWDRHLEKFPDDSKWRTTPFPWYDDMFILVDGKIATGDNVFRAGTASQPSSQPSSTGSQVVLPLEPSQSQEELIDWPSTPPASAPPPSSNSNLTVLASVSTAVPISTPARKRLRADSDPFTPPKSQKRGKGDQLGDIASGLHSIGRGLAANEPTPKRRRKAIALLEEDADFSPDSKRKVLRVFRREVDIADTFLSISDKETRTGYLLDELVDIDYI